MPEQLLEQLNCMANYVRNPHNPPPPGLEARRLAIYRRLFIGNIESLLAASFPVIHRTLPRADWQRLVHDFYANHRSQTPLFTQLAGEFATYLEQCPDLHDFPAWLPELAQHEWSESALLLSDAVEPSHNPHGDLIDGVPVVSGLAWVQAYEWPVCDIGPNYQPTEKPAAPTLVLLQRRAGRVTFSRLAPMAYALLVSLIENRRSGREHLVALADAAGVTVRELMPAGVSALEGFKVQGIVLGTRWG
ncbi:putative DNA-binding domain-containing protein [Pseudomonas sp. SWRI102]|uniref:DNA-binding domain-containing protein n=1 Tax=Pseudomonas marvdashtae TaxID=2745500 RepID=A0A923FN58_9PSED|nr:putative DNA-binding domain-containing protein [Pseudomonas marvdashtae]MBV4552562.1 putative DNA-binding domain-containing protein [Pseudomonas marvdashtae]